VSSRLGRYVVPFTGLYCASKWATEALAEASSYELGPFGFDVAIVEPAVYPTGLLAKDAGADDPDRAASYSEVARYRDALNNALDRATQSRDPGDVAREIVRLAELPAGERPLRTAMPATPAMDENNATLASYQHQPLQSYGLGDLLPKTVG
jgi:NAD(P)-dependent dehydrogenase (short-subunit alcohol dehydrogenase family)